MLIKYQIYSIVSFSIKRVNRKQHMVTWALGSSGPSADGTKMSGAFDTPEGWDAIQRHMDRLGRMAHGNLMKFNKAK